jgi:GGDEF domain-containing protein
MEAAMSHQNSHANSQGGMKQFLLGSVSHAWLLAGGFSGAGIAIIIALIDNNPQLGLYVIGGVTFLLLLLAFYRQWQNQHQLILTVERDKQQLQRLLDESPDAHVQLEGTLYKSALDCLLKLDEARALPASTSGPNQADPSLRPNAVRFLADTLENNVMEGVRLLHNFRCIYLGIHKSELGEGKDGYRWISRGNLRGISIDESLLTTNQNTLVTTAFSTEKRQITTIVDKSGRKIALAAIPLKLSNSTDSNVPNRVWGVMVVHHLINDSAEVASKFNSELDRLEVNFIYSHLAPIFQCIVSAEQKERSLDAAFAGITHRSLYLILRVHETQDGGITINFEAETEVRFAGDYKDARKIIQDHGAAVARVSRENVALEVHGEMTSSNSGDNYHLCLLPLEETDCITKDKKILAILDRGQYMTAVTCNWDTLQRLLARMASGLNDPETGLASQGLFRRNFSLLLKDHKDPPPLGLLVVQVEKAIPSIEVKQNIAAAITQWLSALGNNSDSSLAVASRLDGLSYALTLLVRDDTIAKSLAEALVDLIQVKMAAINQTSEVSVGIAVVPPGNSLDADQVFAEALATLHEAQAQPGRIQLKHL